MLGLQLAVLPSQLHVHMSRLLLCRKQTTDEHDHLRTLVLDSSGCC